MIVSARDALPFTVTLPKLRLEGLAVRSPGVTPVPVNPIVRGELEASDVIVTLPLTAPAAWGPNATVKVVLCELVRVKGAVMPLS